MALTRRQKEILEFIAGFVARNGYAPSLAEIGTAFHLSSPATVHKHLASLEAKGKIRRAKHRRRSIDLVPEELGEPGRELPLLGRVSAGRPAEAVEDRQTLVVPAAMARRERCFVLQVSGDSMIDEQIRDGDYVVVEDRAEAANGETVVALLRGREVTLKKYYREKGVVRLQPANPTLRPVRVSGSDLKELRIQGVVVGLLRFY